MKSFVLIVISNLLVCFLATAQSDTSSKITVKRSVPIHFINKDSVSLPLNEDFDRIEDSCSLITRYAHIDRKTHKFYGPFKDISKLDSEIVLTEGTYNNTGQKDGHFITYYQNGILQAKGNFKNDGYDGAWEIFYDTGKPKLTFEANGKDIKIINAWDDKGTKTIENGKGNYNVDLGRIYWTGNLLNGKPDGTWRIIKTGDAKRIEIATENYKNGVFQKGRSTTGSYTDEPRLVLVPADMLPFTRAESLRISRVPCNGVKRTHIIRAQTYTTSRDFAERIVRLVKPYIFKVDRGLLERDLVLEGEIDTKGQIVNLTSHSLFDDEVARGVIRQLYLLPLLQPATANGVPVKDGINIIFNFKGNTTVHVNYHILPVKL